MKKREFLKTTGTVALGGVVSPFTFCSNPENNSMSAKMSKARWNWAGNLQYSTENYYQPESIDELQSIIRSCSKIKTIGTTHCFNLIADSRFNQVSVKLLDYTLQVDPDAMTATVGAGASYGQICPPLYDQGFALHNLASLPHISVAGAMATATHGSGVKNGNLGSTPFNLKTTSGLVILFLIVNSPSFMPPYEPSFILKLILVST